MLETVPRGDRRGAARAHRRCGPAYSAAGAVARPSIHGKHIVALFVCHSGAVADGEQPVAAIKSLGSPVGDIVQRRTYVSQQALLDATQPKGRRYYWKSEYLPAIDQQLVSRGASSTRRR